MFVQVIQGRVSDATQVRQGVEIGWRDLPLAPRAGSAAPRA
jgi:hypothetical protein